MLAITGLPIYTKVGEEGVQSEKSRGKGQEDSAGCYILIVLLYPWFIQKKAFLVLQDKEGKRKKEHESLWKTGRPKFAYQLLKVNEVIQKSFISFMDECYIWKKK